MKMQLLNSSTDNSNEANWQCNQKTIQAIVSQNNLTGNINFSNHTVSPVANLIYSCDNSGHAWIINTNGSMNPSNWTWTLIGGCPPGQPFVQPLNNQS